MKTALRLTITLALAALSLSAVNTTAQVVNIPDAGLNAAIRQVLNKPTGDITVADMESLTTLNASLGTRGWEVPLIDSLEGLQAARNLTHLDLSGECTTDPLGGPNLSISDLTPLGGLTIWFLLNMTPAAVKPLASVTG
jgi:hypothetical protein